MKKINIPVAREGYPFIAFAGFMTIVVALLDYDMASLASLALTAFVLYFFRDPERVAPAAGDAVASPADGKVIAIDKVFDDRYTNEHVYKISIFMNVFNVHVNRTPFPGTVTDIQYSPGRFYAANSERAALENETCAVVMESANGRKFAFVQMAGLIARRIVCWAEPGDRLRIGQRFGLIRFGSRVDIYLPSQVQIEVRNGQKVRAGETVLGYFPV
jgi:phosphatidylserine decarboxylase